MLMALLNMRMKFIEFALNYPLPLTYYSHDLFFKEVAKLAKSLKCGRLMRECHRVIKESFDPYAIEGVINAYLELLKYFSEQVKTREVKVL